MTRKGFFGTLVGVFFAPKMAAELLKHSPENKKPLGQVFMNGEVWYTWGIVTEAVKKGDILTRYREGFWMKSSSVVAKGGIAMRSVKGGEMLPIQISTGNAYIYSKEGTQ